MLRPDSDRREAKGCSGFDLYYAGALWFHSTMTDGENEEAADQNELLQNSQEPIKWEKFLANSPPYQRRTIIAMGNPGQGAHYTVLSPTIEVYCDHNKCSKLSYFDSKSSRPIASGEKYGSIFLDYFCRHCGQTFKTYALFVRAFPNLKAGAYICEAMKIGEWPAFGPHVPTKMFSLLGEDQDTFHKGRRAESQGMGVGAFAYYRRVVENQKNRLIDEIIKVGKKLGADQETIARLEAARAETQFHKAVGIIKDGIPDVLRIEGHNPLILLHTALSDGLHDKSDEECLARATSIRVVMAELAERITQALSARDEFTSAVSKLLTIAQEKGKKPGGGKPPDQPTTQSSAT
jgi:hypothetical protein